MTRNTVLGLSHAACLAAGFLIAGCAPKHQIDANALDGIVQPVLDRHDAYVAADGSLLPVEKETYERSSAQIRALIDEALEREPAPAPVEPSPVTPE